MNKEEIIIEHKIIDLLRKDNVNKNTFHFRFYFGGSSENNLVLYTYRPRTETMMIYHKVHGKTKIDCLNQMFEYVKGNVKKMEYSWTVIWEGPNKEHNVSYFRGITESDIKVKCTVSDNNVKKIISITKMPIS
tara:strand:- start:2336 stop:2734 length:399 start_codon:yes stop_codon:yes gene_type:complete